MLAVMAGCHAEDAAISTTAANAFNRWGRRASIRRFSIARAGRQGSAPRPRAGHCYLEAVQLPGRSILSLALALCWATPAGGQVVGPPPAPPTERSGAALVPTPHRIRWYEATTAAAGVALLMLADEPVQRYAQRHRSPTTDDLAAVSRRAGQPEVFGTVSLALLAVGVLDHRPEVTRAGGRLVASLALAGTSTLAVKTLIGRARPSAGVGAFAFHPFSGDVSLPSGHTAMAFALATDLSDELDRGWVRVGLYTIASGTALSRINDNRHWVSDVTLGALVGIASAKLVSGRWRIFGITPPRFLSPQGRLVIGWQQSF